MALVWAVLMLLGAVGLLVGLERLSAKFRRRREQLDTHRPEVDLDREIYIQQARSQDFVDY